MAERFLVAIDLQNLQNGLDLKTISYLNRVHVTVAPDDYPQALSFVQDHFNEFNIYCDCTALIHLDQIISLLNCGATKVFVTWRQLEAIVEDHLLAGQDVNRLILSLVSTGHDGLTGDARRSFLEKVKPLVPDISIGLEYSDVRQTFQDKAFSSLYMSPRYPTREQYSVTIELSHVAIIPARELTTNSNQHPNLLPAHVLLTAALQSDRADGLFPTIVSDQRGNCLGLVYSNEESIETALRLGCGAYHSRRHGLWIKGQESGNTQELISIALDCDADALQFTVRQKGQGK